MAEVVERARDAMVEWDEAMQSQSGLTDEEIARRYADQHRGKPDAILRFVENNAPEDADPLDAAVEYERRMEDLLRQHRRRDAT